jgi:hypothetical protein
MGSHHSFGQKKGLESNWQFDSRPQKVGNRPNFLAFKQRATYVGKFSTRATTLLQTSSQSEVYTKSYGLPKSRESQRWEFRDSLPFGSPETKSHLDVAPVDKCRVYYKGEGGGFTKCGRWWVLWVPIARGSSNYALTTLCWFCVGLCE